VKAEKASITSSSTKILIHYEGTDTYSTRLREVLLIVSVPSEITPIQLENQPRPGILVVTLYEGAGLATSDQYKQVFNCYKHDTPAGGNAFMVRRFLPYALLDFDKSQVSSDSLRGTPEDPKWQGDMTPYEFDVSRIAELTVYLYLKNQNAARGSQDKFIGVARMTPRFEESHEEKAPDAEWLDVQDGTGKIRIRVEYVENRTLKPKVSNYYHHTGTVGSVMQVRKYDTKRLHALKYIPKANIISEVAHAFLFQINHPFIAPLALAFQTPEKIYLFSPFVRGGHLFAHLQREQRFDIDRSRFYIAEILCALEYLHRFNIIYCDLKPRNIVLDLLGHITICDFGLCKLEKKDEDRTTTFHGTLEYPAPELLLGQGYTETVGMVYSAFDSSFL
jgi:serum/glucocorticoid-regulated kinase 2